MRTAGVLLLLVAALLVSSCGEEENSVESIITAVGPEQLRRDAAVLYKQAFAASNTRFAVISKSTWPASFRRFRPIRVGAYRDGFSLTLATTPQTESGIYVVPSGMELSPAQTTGTKFEKVADGIFRYSFRN